MYKCASDKSKTLITAILSKSIDRDKCKSTFITHLLILFLQIPIRHHFKGMERYGNYNEKTYRLNFKKYGTSYDIKDLSSSRDTNDKFFDFRWFNQSLITDYLSDNLLVVFDPSFLPKSGKSTYGVSHRWSGCAGKAKWGMELGGLGVVDLDCQSAFHYEGILTPSDEELQSKATTLLEHYAQIIVERRDDLSCFSNYLCVDGFFSKKSFVDTIKSDTDLEVVSKLRKDSHLRYLYNGPKTGKRGRPKKFDGKVDISNIKSRYFKTVLEDDEKIVHEAIVWANALERKIKLAYVQFKNEQGDLTNRYVLLFSTDLKLSALEIVEFYTARFHIEFLFRDAKQHTGLTHCQARKEEKIYFHVNTALTAVNIAKIAHWIEGPCDAQGNRPPFSLSSIKTLYFNELNLNLFISMFDIDPNTEINKAKYQLLINFGSMAA